MTANNPTDDRLTRRGRQIFQLAMEMEIGPVEEGEVKAGAETLIALTDSIAHCSAFCSDPRGVIDQVAQMLEKVDDGWFTEQRAQRNKIFVSRKGDLLAESALEMAFGKEDDDRESADRHAAQALKYLIDAVIYIATLDENPRLILERVVQAFDETAVEALQ